MTDVAEATNHLSDHFEPGQVMTSDVEDVLRRGVSIDRFMQRHRLPASAENDWLTVRRDLDELARAYTVAWNWFDPRSTGDEGRTGLYQRLTGTYQLAHERGDDPRLADSTRYSFAGVIETVRTVGGLAVVFHRAGIHSDRPAAVQRGAIGAALGAMIGAIGGGGQGAVIGAVIGAGAGAGTVIVQGRDQLDLPRGTELTIPARAARTSTSRQHQ